MQKVRVPFGRAWSRSRAGAEGQWIFVGSGDAGRMLCLMVGFVIPDVSRPGVLGNGGEKDDGGLVVDAPGGEALAVEGAFELGVEASRCPVACRRGAGGPYLWWERCAGTRFG